MSRVRLPIIFMLAAACAPREGAMAGREGTSEPLCWWRNARWDDRGTLLLRGTQVPLARARARWAGDAWKGATTTAVLRRNGNSVVLEGEWAGPGLVLSADVDVAKHAVFRAFEPYRIGTTGLVLKGGHVRVLDALVGRALVVPADESMQSFRTDEPLVAEVGCDGLSLSAPAPRPGDAARAQLEQAGFAANAKEKWLPENASLPVSAQPGGPTVGFFVADERAVRGFVVEERDGEARLVVPTPGGVVWVGWVAAEPLRVPEAVPVAPADAPATSSASQEWRACTHREFPLTLEFQGRLLRVGTLSAGTPFSVEGRVGDYRKVTLALDWLELSPRLQVLVPSDAVDCPRLRQTQTW